ncbi:hypothetical protein JCM8097_008295 [Rhodosporidiobolus ruineniae]
MSNPHAALAKGNIAVITGASVGGIGYAVAELLLQRFGMHVFLADVSLDGLEQTRKALIAAGIPEEQFTTRETNVADSKDVQALADAVYASKGKVDFLFLNAGVGCKSKSIGGDLEDWNKTLSVNLGGVINGQHAFVERMVAQQTPAAVVITGSKQGITCPPGTAPAYNASKAAVKSLTESLAHHLLSTSVTAHLLVPGWTYTKLSTGGSVPEAEKKPAGAWTAAQVAEELFSRLDEFYIICPDNDTPFELDAARMQYNLDDILLKRPALSRWNPQYAASYEKYVAEKVAKK